MAETNDVLIVGGGPAGATAALYAARAGLSTLVVDKGLTAGALAAASQIVNFPGVPGPIAGTKLVELIRAQGEAFGARYVHDRALFSDLGGPEREVHGGKDVYRGRAVIVATGARGRQANLPGEARLVGHGVSYCATCDGAFFAGREVAVAGDHDEAAEEALFLARLASHVHLLVPGPRLRATDKLAGELADHPHVELHLSTRPVAILGDDRVEAVRLSGPTGQLDLPVSGVFLYLQGGSPSVGFLGGQLATTEQGCLVVDDTMQTSIPGVFACGDVLCKHLKQAVIAAAEGAAAAMAAERFISGRTKLRPAWS
ncbi:MAG: NAD(P)/FAD-dependent oxidoreductase [Candidatus Bipolaricaulaceae bacterium]